MWTWGDEHARAFQELKLALVSSPVLRIFDRHLEVVLHTDASDRAVGAVLMQNDGQGLRPVCYTAKKLSGEEVNYPVQQKEMFAVVHALRVWRHYLGCPFKVVSDHLSLQYVKTSPDPTHRLARWFDELALFAFEIVYSSGKKHVVADYLSRNAAAVSTISASSSSTSTASVAAALTVTVGEPEFLDRVRQGYAEDTYFAPVHAHLIGNAPLEHRFATRVDKYVARDGLLYFAKKDALCIPDDKELRTLVLMEMHDAGGHFGLDKTYAALARRFFWPHMGVTAKKFIESCAVCQRHKGAARSAQGLLMPLEVPERPWSDVSMNFVSGLPKTERGNDAILTWWIG